MGLKLKNANSNMFSSSFSQLATQVQVHLNENVNVQVNVNVLTGKSISVRNMAYPPGVNSSLHRKPIKQRLVIGDDLIGW